MYCARMEHNKKTDFQILVQITTRYLWNAPAVRQFMMLAMALMITSCYLEVLVPEICRKISKELKHGRTCGALVFYYAFAYAASISLSELQAFIVCGAGQSANRRANRNAYRFFLRLTPSSFQKFGKGEIQNTVNRKSQAVQDIIDVFTLKFFPTFLTVLIITLRVISNMGLIPVVIINLSIILYAWATIKITVWRNKIRQKVNKDTNNTSDILMDGLMSHETVLVHDNIEYEVDRYDSSLKVLEMRNTSLFRSLCLLNFVQRGVWCIQAIAIVSIIAMNPFGKKMATEDLAFFIGLVAVLVKTLDNFGFMYGKYKQAMINMRIDVEHSVESIKEGNVRLDSFRDSLKTEGLFFGINGRIILEKVNFTVRKGEKVAVIGKNGAGKSTLIKILMMLRSQTKGSVTIDGYDTRELKSDSLRRIIAYVPQNATLLSGSVLYNVKYGNRKMADDEIVELGGKLGLNESIYRLKDGYNTDVQEQGSGLSGGERQKIAIMRAIATGSKILVMDEPTASLDKRAEQEIMKRLLSFEELTIIAIVHNHNLLSLFDRVLVVESKSVREVNKNEAIDLGDWK